MFYNIFHSITQIISIFEDASTFYKMQKQLLLADEAIAQAAIDAGLSGIYAYPGTPSTEIMEFAQSTKQGKEKMIRCDWSSNEKTAYEAALGMSYTGKRTMVCMKHVGLNVAADGFINSAITGVNGGLVLVVADDPSMHSSQNEQDSRFYGKFALIPILEPSNQQEAYDMVFSAFTLSEKYKTPIMMRITTRLAHSRAAISRKPAYEQNEISLPGDPLQFVLLPAIARARYKELIGNQAYFEGESEKSEYNKYNDAPDKKLGIIACGIAYNYLAENFTDQKIPHPVLKITQYPLPRLLVEMLYNSCDELLILEDGYPFIEEQLKGYLAKGKTIHGRLDDTLPRDGELNPDIVGNALGMNKTIQAAVPSIVVNRPPSLCKGCAHSDIYNALNEALTTYTKGRVFSDIGCYTLGALPPYNAIYSCVDMGASITMAKGAADAGLVPSVAVIGDSTFTHSGMTGLLDAVNDKSSVTILICDNSTTGMTGGQKSSATGKLEQICLGLGVEPEHLITFNPLKRNHEENVEIIKKELLYSGVSVIIGQRECIQTLARKNRHA
jgi:indolepyruvate ferredoxin oxidoreductase alpha subunit